MKIAGKNLPTPKPPAKVTIPHSPNFSTRFSSRTSSSATDRNSIAPPKSVNSTPCFKVPSDKTFVSPNPLEKLTAIQFPFTPEPTQPLARREAGDCLDLTPEEPEEDILLPLKDMDPQKTFLLRQVRSDGICIKCKCRAMSFYANEGKNCANEDCTLSMHFKYSQCTSGTHSVDSYMKIFVGKFS